MPKSSLTHLEIFSQHFLLAKLLSRRRNMQEGPVWVVSANHSLWQDGRGRDKRGDNLDNLGLSSIYSIGLLFVLESGGPSIA